MADFEYPDMGPTLTGTRADTSTDRYRPVSGRRTRRPLGILALYGTMLIGPSYYLRDRIGARTWRIIHRIFIPLVYAVGV